MRLHEGLQVFVVADKALVKVYFDWGVLVWVEVVDPVIKIPNGPSAFSKGISSAVTGGANSLVSKGSTAADRLPFDREQLLGVLHFRLHETDRARRRASWFGGRIYNRLSGEDPDYFPVSGAHLMQALGVVRIQAPEFVVAGRQYLLRYDYAKRASDKLEREQQANVS
ncbi:hypothetical protein [Ruegeria sp. HKCCA5491]|uniref:hypothetical protein n=1 Tax=Ruegeria sp. HKCCA5491 TaxID=2682986 RepID=UPI0014891B99|nr:hypothetical protein [Ruegeria sp. HKCCA5491]